MIKLKVMLIFFISFGFITNLSAQFDVLKKVKKKVDKRVERKIDKAIDKTLDETEKGIEEGATKSDEESSEEVQSDVEKVENNNNKKLSKPDLKVWSKYNFVPGDKIIFYDDFTGEENGEFPSRWDLLSGNVENADLGGDKIINFENKSIIKPLMSSEEYLPDVFTIEFDAFFGKVKHSEGQKYSLRFWDGSGSYSNLPKNASSKGYYYPLEIYRHGAVLKGKVNDNNLNFQSFENSMKTKDEEFWRHIAIAFNKRSLKVFVDKERMLNIPNLHFQPKMFSIQAFTNSNETAVRSIKNVRVAEGGKGLYDRVMADGRIVTRGILFDVNKANIKPESMGTLNEIAKLMKDHSDIRFSIEGHTDSDGDESFNKTLSEKRAESVKQALNELGVDESRLESKGFGESVPVDVNSTPEGKANNRRVEFVKI